MEPPNLCGSQRRRRLVGRRGSAPTLAGSECDTPRSAGAAEDTVIGFDSNVLSAFLLANRGRLALLPGDILAEKRLATYRLFLYSSPITLPSVSAEVGLIPDGMKLEGGILSRTSQRCALTSQHPGPQVSARVTNGQGNYRSQPTLPGRIISRSCKGKVPDAPRFAGPECLGCFHTTVLRRARSRSGTATEWRSTRRTSSDRRRAWPRSTSLTSLATPATFHATKAIN